MSSPSNTDPPDAPPTTSRRKLVLATALGGCALAAAAAGPAVRVALAPLGSEGGSERWIRTVRLTELEEGKARRVALTADRRDAWTLERDVELGSVWLVRHGDRVVAFSAVCPHLGCSINASPQGGFACPCHTSAFDAAGRRTSGPSPRDLDALDTRIEDGHVVVDYRRFRTGVAEKVERA